MKTSLTILCAAALMFGATVGLMSGAAAAYDSAYHSAGRCGVVACADQQQAQIPSGRYRGH